MSPGSPHADAGSAAAGAVVALEAQLALLTAVLAAMLALERRRPAAGPLTADVAAG